MPVLEFEVLGDRSNFIYKFCRITNFNSSKIYKISLSWSSKYLKVNDKFLRTGAKATGTDAPNFNNNALHSLFLKNTVAENGRKSSNTNGNYAHRAFIETELYSNRTAKNTWLVCQGYHFQNKTQTIDGNWSTGGGYRNESHPSNIFSEVLKQFCRYLWS